MKNPKPAGGRGSAHKTSSAAVSGEATARKSNFDSSKNAPSDRNVTSNSTPSKEDIPGPSSGPPKPPSHTATTHPPAFHHLNTASSPLPPPPPPYGFHNLERRSIVLADGTVRSYFALPPDYQMDPRGDKFFQGFDPRLANSIGSEGFREAPPPFGRGGADYWSSLGLEGSAGSSSLKRKYGEEEFARHRQQVLQHGRSAVNPMGFASGPIGSPPRKEHVDDMRLSKQVKLGGEGYDNLGARRLRAEGGESRDLDQSALKDAFLRFCKSISENSTYRKSCLEDGKSGPLQCVVCGRGGKEFADVHGLIMHAYNAQNSDLRIDHLGLHKALCVMSGWNHAKAPDNSKEYQSLSADEARTNREDLILWPPTVIIHNTSTGKRKDGRMEGLGNKEMEAKLKELGFGGGKAKSVYGKEGHLGFTAVRFSSTEVGLREAENLVEYFEKDNRGRNGWARASQSGNNEEKNPDLVKVDKKTGEKNRIFFGYLATAMDLDKVEFDMRKKVVIKIRKELDFE